MAQGQQPCPCEGQWDFGEFDTCDPQKAGINRCFVVVCLSKVDIIAKKDCDPMNPETSGVIDDVQLVENETANQFFALPESVEITSGMTVSDSGNSEISETIVAKGTVGSPQMCWIKAHLNKEIVVFFEDNDGELWAMGWDEGLRLTESQIAFGVATGDEKAITVTFNNTSGDTICRVDYVAMGFPDIQAFLTSIL